MQTNARHVSPAVGEFAVTEMARLKEENDRLREALEVYANRENWRDDDWGVPAIIDAPNEYGNPGAIARAVLAEKRA